MVRRPEECRTKDEIRAEIDRLDEALVSLFAERFAYVRRMAALKGGPDEALVPARVEEVLERVARHARDAGLDEDLARKIWSELIDWNIDYERRVIADRLGRRGGA